MKVYTLRKDGKYLAPVYADLGSGYYDFECWEFTTDAPHNEGIFFRKEDLKYIQDEIGGEIVIFELTEVKE